MNLIIRPALLADLPFCVGCIRDDFLFADDATRLIAYWNYLFASGRAISGVMEDLNETHGYRIVGFGIGVFLNPQFADDVRAGRHPYYSRRLMERWEQGECPLLDAPAIRAANSGPGLTMLNLHSGMPRPLLTSEAGRAVRDENGNFNYFGVAGYRLNEYLIEVYGPFERDWVHNLGMCFRADFLEQYAEEGNAPEAARMPYLFGLSREEARRAEGSAIGRVFAYQEPRFRFTPPQQETLLHALSGATDKELSRSLSVSLAAIRKRWTAIYAHVEETEPGLICRREESRAAGDSGAQKKRRLLQYLRYHLEELRPYQHPPH